MSGNILNNHTDIWKSDPWFIEKGELVDTSYFELVDNFKTE